MLSRTCLTKIASGCGIGFLISAAAIPAARLGGVATEGSPLAQLLRDSSIVLAR